MRVTLKSHGQPEIEAKTILVIQPFGLGDAIAATSLVQALASLPGRKVSVVGNPNRSGGWQVLKACPGVNKLYTSRDRIAIREQRFDVAITCTSNKTMAASFGARRAIAAVPDPNKRVARGKPKWAFHNTAYLLRTARRLGYTGMLPTPVFPINKEIEVHHEGPKIVLGAGYAKVPSDMRKPAWDRKSWGAYHKHWGDQNFIKVAQLVRSLRGTCFLVGDRYDHIADAKDIAIRSRGAAISLCGKLSIAGIGGLLKQCDAYVGNDTAIMHMAEALDMHLMTVFKVQNVIVKWRPINPNGAFLYEAPGTDVYPKVESWVRQLVGKLREKK